MNKKREWRIFGVIAAVVLVFLVATFFKMEWVVPLDEAKEHVTVIDTESAVIVTLNYTGGTVYAYNDEYLKTGKEGNVYVVLKMSLLDRWFGKPSQNFGSVVIHKAGNAEEGYTDPVLWYLPDINRVSESVPFDVPVKQPDDGKVS